jgi:hypothetical protein
LPSLRLYCPSSAAPGGWPSVVHDRGNEGFRLLRNLWPLPPENNVRTVSFDGVV